MKKYILVIALTLTLVAQATAQSTTNRYVINGTLVNGVAGDTVILYHTSGQYLVPFDTAYVSDGTFRFVGNVEGAQMYFLGGVRNARPTFRSMLITEGGNISVTLHQENEHIAVKGSEAHTTWGEVVNGKDNSIAKEQNRFITIAQGPNYSQSEKIVARRGLDSLSAVVRGNLYNYINNNPTKKVSDLFFSLIYSGLSIGERENLMAKLSKNNPLLPGYKSAKTALEQAGKYKNFTMKDVNGNYVTVSDIVKKNKLTLIDFWASWCGPCRMEMPHVLECYNNFHDDGFEVIGVSLDNTQKAWENGIKALGLTWIQLSDLKGWSCEAAKLYGIHSIPSSILVDSSGRIVAKDLRGENLSRVVAQTLGVKE